MKMFIIRIEYFIDGVTHNTKKQISASSKRSAKYRAKADFIKANPLATKVKVY